ncbi:hypothetical protein N7495_001079 [Penicillium taxi]|uniref:uncharacterized protein n=1 Tax=Penicillium taxi TaxID=168475 RepID=UPI0025454DCB|nr:uncharacterized protein N7495_001079 [Penicillium taxi]KAJ5908397.1 hypothetical protein N7495_001079 [Penicillium taxi]
MSLPSLISHKSSDSGLQIHLHPLVLLTISDHITRHAARHQEGPILGALFGQQNGQVITLENAFECPTKSDSNGQALIPEPWFAERVQQFKDVYKDPPLEIVGWWTAAAPSGPDASHLPIHRQILQDYNDSAVILAFHPEQLQQSRSQGARLPLTIYENVLEGDDATDGDKEMQIDGEELAQKIRFRELPYTVETGEAEMIGVDTIATGSGTAAWHGIQSTTTDQTYENQSPFETGEQALSQEEESLIANLSTRLNAVRTLQSRISLIKSYVTSISESNNADTPLPHSILRNVNSLISNLAILSPSDESTFSMEVISQNNDVMLASLLGKMGEVLQTTLEMDVKASIVNQANQTSQSSLRANKAFDDELRRNPHLR